MRAVVALFGGEGSIIRAIERSERAIALCFFVKEIHRRATILRPLVERSETRPKICEAPSEARAAAKEHGKR